MKNVSRFDVGEIRTSINSDGYLEDTPVVGRVGIQVYRNPDGSLRRELRPPEEVFNADSLASFKGKPVTIGHPGAVNAKNARKHMVGTILDAGREDGELVKAPIIVYDESAIKSAETGKRRQLSLGYRLDLDETPGEWNGQPYDAVQRNIRINHLALVTKARAGDVATLNLDGDEEITSDDENKPEGNKMQKIRLDSGLEYEAAPEVVVAYQALKQDAAETKTKLETATSEITKLQAQVDTLQADAAEFDEKLNAAKNQAIEDAKNRAELEVKAQKHGIKCDGLDDMGVKKAVIKKLKPGLNLDGKDDAYICAAFDLNIDTAPIERQRETINSDKTRSDAADGASAATSRQKYLNRLRGIKE